MDVATTERLMKIFEACAGLEPWQQQDLIDSDCSEEPEMRRYLEALLEKTEHLDRNTLIRDGGLRGYVEEISDAHLAPGSIVGRYRILKRISKGGMGVVLLAERTGDKSTGRVAIKIIRRGMDSDAILESFDRERRILATLKSHPNIVHLEDADTTEDGSPYFVMEFIDGMPLDRFCEDASLGIKQRLELFIKVCGAVAFAHQRTIVHRDLKPGNILVTPEGEPKLLDFGISKLISTAGQEASISVVQELRIMTLEYASPEQVRGDDLDVRTDVYSLGVILFRLLAKTAPYDLVDQSPAARERLVCDVEPPLLSEALRPASKPDLKQRRELEGNLDNIVRQALRKDPERRYSSVEQFSQDIRRHLENLPVSARPDTWQYRTSQFVRRHRGGVITASSFLVLVLLSIVLVAWQAHVALVQRRRAENRFNDVKRLADWMLFDFHDSIEKLPGSTEPRRQLIQHAMTYLDSLASEAGGDTSLERDLAVSYLKLGDIIGDPRDINQGDMPAALASYNKSLELLNRLQQSGAQDPLVLHNIAITQQRIGGINEETGNLTQALAYQRKAAATLEQLAKIAPTVLNRRGVPVSHTRIGEELLLLGKPQEALVEFQAGLPLTEQLYDEDRSNFQLKRDLSVYYSKFGDVYEATGALNKSLDSYKKSLALREELRAAQPVSREAARDIGSSADSISTVLTDMKRYPEAIHYERQALNIALEQSATDRTDVQALRDAADGYIGIAQLQLETHLYREALASANQSLALRQRVVDGNPSDVLLKAAIADTYILESNAETNMHRTADAANHIQKGVAMAEAAHTTDPSDTRYTEVLARAYFQAAIVAAGADHSRQSSAKALKLYEQSNRAFSELKQGGGLNEEDKLFLAASEKAITRLRKTER